MANATTRVVGLDSTSAKLSSIVRGVSAAIDKQIDIGARAIQRRARSLAPKKTGELARKISVQRGRYGITKMVRAKAPHSPLQEFGTKRGVTAKKFMKRAEDELLPGIQARIMAAVKGEVER